MKDIIDSFYSFFIKENGYKLVIEGFGLTVRVAVFGLLIGMVIGCILATMKVLQNLNIATKIMAKFTDIYVAVFRGTPIVVQLLMSQYGIFASVDISPETVAILVFGLNSAAYISEIMRGGILSVDIGQTEAGRALGLNYGRTMISIVIPQAIKNVIPTLGNEFITLIKETSVVSFIALTDITIAFKAFASRTYQVIPAYIVLAACYLVMGLIITLGIRFLERRLRASDKR